MFIENIYVYTFEPNDPESYIKIAIHTPIGIC